jgi:hypothetical protein
MSNELGDIAARESPTTSAYIAATGQTGRKEPEGVLYVFIAAA